MRTFAASLALCVVGLVLLAETALAQSSGITAPAAKTWPTPEQIAAVYPGDALAKRIGGRGNVACALTTEGLLEDCKIVGKDEHGFGAAVLKLTETIRFSPETKDGVAVRAKVNIPIDFAPPAAPVPVTEDPQAPPIGAKVVTQPQWVKRPSREDIIAVYPREAIAKNLGGAVTLTCEVTPEGVTAKCATLETDNPGIGFAQAALLLAPSFLFKPAMVDGAPTTGHIVIPLRWESAGGDASKSINDLSVTRGSPTGGTKFLRVVPWVRAPRFSQVQDAYPSNAQAADSGHVVLQCGFASSGALKNCSINSETPEHMGFAKAARSLVDLFQAGPPEILPTLDAAQAMLAIHFTNPAKQGPGKRTLSDPKWIALPDASVLAKVYPPQALKANVFSGRAAAECTIDVKGALTQCAVASEAPAGLGFGEAAMAVASVMRVNLWTETGLPAEGSQVRASFRFNAEQAAAPAPAQAAP